MKKIILFLIAFVPCFLTAQNTYSSFEGHYNIMTFFGNNHFGNGGFTITTNIPSNEQHNATVYIKGFDNVSRTIGLQVSWFYSGDEFTDYAASSTGAWIPERTRLDRSGNFIQIHFDGFSDLQNLEITALSEKIYDPQWFTHWKMDDGSGDGVEVNYNNRFEEIFTKNLYSEGAVNGAFGSITGNLAVGENIGANNLYILSNARISGNLALGGVHTAVVPLHTLGGVRFGGLANGVPNNKVLSTDNLGNLTLVDKGGYWQPHSNNSTIVYNGTVGIGITASTALNTSSTYKLVVGGTIAANKIKVTQSGWADYVFAKDYRLKPLTDIEKFIKKYGHLPEVPTTNEVANNGVDIGETQVILLKKIEELTLHLIEQNKKIEKLERKIKYRK